MNVELTAQSFNRLLNWLDGDPERAGQKYEEIRLRLIKIFVCRGCACPEDLADQTINRVSGKLPEIVDSYVGDPALYFYNVARLIWLEFSRKQASIKTPPAPLVDEEIEPAYQCLDHCLAKLSSKDRELILAYYQEEKQAKIESRKNLAERLGIALNALRIRTTRIRASLEQCVQECLKREVGLASRK